MPATHTTGPWNPIPAPSGNILIEHDTQLVAKVIGDYPADAALICAAPDLLAALIVLRERHQIDDPHHTHLCEFCQMADAAIAKATGSAQ